MNRELQLAGEWHLTALPPLGTWRPRRQTAQASACPPAPTPHPHRGSARNAGSKPPRTTVGLSTRFATSSSRSPRVLSGMMPAQRQAWLTGWLGFWNAVWQKQALPAEVTPRAVRKDACRGEGSGWSRWLRGGSGEGTGEDGRGGEWHSSGGSGGVAEGAGRQRVRLDSRPAGSQQHQTHLPRPAPPPSPPARCAACAAPGQGCLVSMRGGAEGQKGQQSREGALGQASGRGHVLFLAVPATPQPSNVPTPLPVTTHLMRPSCSTDR